MRHDLRQSVGFVDFVASLGGGAIVVYIVWTLAESPMQEIGDNAQLETVRRSHQWTELLLNNLPIMFALIAVTGAIAFVIYQTEYA